MEIEKLKIINGEVETEVSYQEITKDTSPFKEILEKTEYYSYKLSFSDEQTYSLEDVFHLLVNVNLVGEFSFFFALDGFKKKEIIKQIRELKSIVVEDEESAQKKIEAVFEIVNEYQPIFLVYKQKGEYLLSKEGLNVYAESYPVFYFGKEEAEEETSKEVVESQVETENKEEETPVIEEVKPEEEKVNPDKEAFLKYLSNFNEEQVKEVHKILKIRTPEEEAFVQYLMANYSKEQVIETCRALGIEEPDFPTPVKENKPSFVTKETKKEQPSKPAPAPEKRKEEKNEEESSKPQEQEEKSENSFASWIKDIWKIIVSEKFSVLFVMVAALIIELATYIGFNYAYGGKGICVFFFICAFIGAGLNGFVYYDMFKEGKVNKKVIGILSTAFLIGALIGLGGYAIFYNVQKEKPEGLPAFILLTLITLLIAIAVDIIAVLIARFVSKKMIGKGK